MKKSWSIDIVGFLYLYINHKSIKMKNLLILFVFIITSSLFSQNQERLSVHYMNIPDEQYEDFMKFHNKKNEILEKAGFGKNFYKLYKVKDSDKAEKYRYFLISNYTSDKHYKMTHNVSLKLDNLNNDFWDSDLAPIFEDDENHIYRRVYRIDE